MDNLDDKTRSSVEEKEADEGARNALIPPEIWMQSAVSISHDQEDAIKLADDLRIHPAIVAGRVRYQTNDWRLLSRLIKGGSVRELFEKQG
ncbi:hypothetical protein JWZ98_00035 [Methylomonas sp. EFPC1]|uniref:hypothetical protein n=1 Tax=Methylomonas sp. EFPC1 TaxID=2812647 RepID=UPI001967612D|nr:hypothetical protein [Methylomonas sp. EFPC1]QSB01404.1 hypothetical protein JWZ98_00035 [Methylomonas sp. EFPC1]